MPKAGRPPKNDLPQPTFVLDNGGDTIKAGFAPAAGLNDEEALQRCQVIPNILARTRDRRTYVATQTEQISQWNDAVFRRPVEHGQLVNWQSEQEIWEYGIFDEKTASKNTFIKRPQETTLILTEAPNTLPALQKNTDEIVMEEWGFGGYSRIPGPPLNAYNDLHPLFGNAPASAPASKLLPVECLLLIDSGFSHTTITPIYNGKPLHRAVRRIDIGGKHLTNLLKELFSLRHFNVTQDFKIVNDMKEHISFVSQDFGSDMEKTWKGNKGRRKASSTLSVESNTEQMELDVPPSASTDNLILDYILPDGIHLLRGFSRPHDPSTSNPKKRKVQALSAPSPTTTPTTTNEITATLGTERFAVPEILFSPSDIGSTQPGLADCIMQSLSVLPPLVQATMLANTLVVGGNAKIPGLVERLQSELRARVKAEWVVRVRKMDDPVTSTWLGGARLATRNRIVVREYAVTRAEYEEHGQAWTARKFAGLAR